ncbi:winged helix-turn-helix domain-containing protein, partial [Nostoc sp. FACHB-888]|uniref:winged helix-turn-helix domain-containing protein n=1 Tax=Nostoc sp. FACHB-888 TaxID=2692842 RepID=UPI001A7E3B25
SVNYLSFQPPTASDRLFFSYPHSLFHLSMRKFWGYLDSKQKQTVIQWLRQKDYWHLNELKEYIEESFNIAFESNQSYYNLFKEASISWKKTQKKNPRKDEELVAKKN